jgi:hypothetical protein
VQGSLTSWKVKAKTIQLEESAQARIVLQETDRIEIGKNAKLVGNFASEKELFLLFSRFAQQLRSLPFYFDRKEPPIGRAQVAAAAALPAEEEPSGHVGVSATSSRAREASRELPDELFVARVLRARVAIGATYGSTSVHPPCSDLRYWLKG